MHVLYIPGSYFALIYWIVGSAGLLLALFIGLAQHEKEVLTTDCGKDHYEYWPSISTAIGDMQPERQTWRVAYAIIFGLRVVMMTLGCSLFYQKASRGVSELWNLRRSPLQLMRSSTFLVLLLVVSDGARILGAMGWTLIASFESHTHHNLSFVHFIVYSFFAQLATTMLAKRNRSNLNIYVSQRDASRSIMMKAITMWGETVAAILVVIFYINHRSTCAPGSFSRSTVCEWFFAGFNLAFDGSMWFEYKQVGMWLTAAPNYYMEQWKGRQMGKDGEEVPASAASIPMMEDRSNNSPAPTTSVDGVAPDSPAMVVHTFTFACAPASTTMWFCDVYWCHLWFEMCIHLIQHMYFMPLIAMSLSWEIGTVVLMGAPCLLAIPQFLRWTCGEVPLPQLWLNLIAAPRGCRVVPPFYILLYFLASWTHLQMLIQKEPGTKILALSFGPFLLSLATFVRYFYPSSQAAHRHVESHAEDARRMLFSIPGGFLLCMLLRILFIGQSPLFVAPFYSGVFGIVGGLVCTLHMYRHAVYGPAAAAAAAATNHAEASNVVVMGEVEHMEDPLSKHSASGAEEEDGVARSDSITAMALSYPNPPAPILGALFGLIFAFCITFYTCANYIPRLLAVEPFPANLWVALAFAAGLYHSADVLSLAHLTHRSAHDLGSVRQDGVVSMLLRRAFYGRENVLFGSMLVCCLVMLVGTRQTNFTYELPNPNYPINENTPREAVTIKNWAAQEDFSGRKQVAYLGGLGMTFFFAAMLPAAMEMIICHQRARRQAAVLLDASGRRPPHAMAPHAWTGFEYWWIASFITVGVLYALCISYPFVPLGWIVREKTRPIIFLHLTCIVLLMKAILNRIRRALRQQSNAGGSSSGNVARDQRQPHVLMVVLTLLAFVGVVVFRVALQPGDVSFPLVQNHRSHNFQAEVLYLHRKMLDLRRARNAATDLMATPEEVAFYKARYTAKMEDMERNITRAATAADINPLYGLASVAQAEDRVAIWDAAKAMTSFSGMIWTVHFGLDNYNVDSFQRMVKHIKETEAGIVGILESDSMHLTNGNRDMVEYLSYHLGFQYADYGPTALDNSYGCAIISRYPLHKIKRYIIPSPLGELSCIIHAVADVYGVYVDTYVGHFGNTQHWADGLLQSQFLGQLAVQHSGPAMWLGYLVTHPGMLEKYHRYTHPTQHGLLRDAAYEIYRKRPWVRLLDRGGYDETPPVTVTATPGEDVDFNVEYKLPIFKHLEDGMTPDVSFRRTPLHLPQRHFYFNHTNRYSTAHPRWEFADRYCQYVLYKSGADDEEGNGVRTQPDSPYQMELFDWWRVVHQEDRVDPIQSMSDTEIQVIQFQFKQRAK